MDMVKIRRASSNVEADMIKSFLAQHGIDAFIQGYTHRSMLGVIGTYIELNIMVAEKDAGEARKVIADLPPEEIPDSTKHENDVRAEIDVTRHRDSRVAFILAFILPGLGNYYAGRKNLGGWLIFFTVILYLLLLVATQLFAKFSIMGLGAILIIDAASSVAFILKAKRSTASGIRR